MRFYFERISQQKAVRELYKRYFNNREDHRPVISPEDWIYVNKLLVVELKKK